MLVSTIFASQDKEMAKAARAIKKYFMGDYLASETMGFDFRGNTFI